MDIQKLIQLNIEIEGLLRVIASRESNEAKQLLSSKYAEFKAVFEQEEAAPEVAVQVDEPSAPEQIADPTPADIPQPIMENVATVAPTPVAEEESNQSTPIIAQQTQSNDLTTVEEIVANRPNEMRVDEMLTRREARDLRKAFTLNDKFRFRRELFANNDAQFADTLNILSAMKNMEEAVEYMRDDLGWDMDSDEVKDFVNIISNHFD